MRSGGRLLFLAATAAALVVCATVEAAKNKLPRPLEPADVFCYRCKSFISFMSNRYPLPSNDDVCKICKNTVQEIQKQLDPKTIDDIHKQVDQMCGHFKVIGMDKQCKQMVYEQVDMAVDYIKHLVPSEVCQRFQLCGNCNQIDAKNICDKIGACDERSLVVETREDQVLYAEGVCELCENVVQEVQKQLDPKAIDDIHKQVDQLCAYLKMVGMDKQCRETLNKQIDQAVDYIRHVKPSEFCGKIQLCSSGLKKMIEQSAYFKPDLEVEDEWFGLGDPQSLQPPTNPPKKSKVKSYEHGPNCMLCKVIVKEIDRLLKNNHTEEDIRVGLDKVCVFAFKNEARLERCEEYVNAYTKELVNLLAEETDPEIVCMLLEQCTHQSDRTLAEPTGVAPQASICDQCVDVISQIDEYLSTHSVEPDVDAIIEQVCNKLPDTAKIECTSIVKAFGENIVVIISSMHNPRQLCEKIQLC